MKVFFPVLLRAVLFPLLGAALFTGCCGSVACNCQNYRADALLFKFDPADFTAAQIDTIIVERSVYPRDSVTQTASGPTYAKPDVVVVVRDRTTVFDTPLVIDNDAPFATVNGRKLGAPVDTASYRYTILVREPAARASASAVVARYYIGRVQLAGKYEADGCCSCYRNDVKRFTLSSFSSGNRRNEVIDAHTDAGEEPKVTILRR